MVIDKHINNKGFTLTEVMLGIMILTIAIVTSTSILVGIINSNKRNVETLQAYYMAQEGIEAVTNMRDTNWLNNLHWLGDETGVPWGRALDLNEELTLEVNTTPASFRGGEISFDELSAYAPWSLNTSDEGRDDFDRTITVLSYEDEHVLVRSTVYFGKGKKIAIEKVLTDWKGNN